MKVKMFAFILLAVLLALAATPVYAAAPVLPHAFYGTIDVNGSPAPVGTQVEVRGEGVETGVGNNPIEVTVEGKYGNSEPLEPKLIVQGDVVEGATVTFYVNGVSTGQTAEWHSGEVTELNISATIEGSLPEPPPPPEQTTEPPPTEPSSPPESTEPPPEPTEPPPESTEPSPSPAPSAPPVPPPPPAGTGNWPVLWMVIGGVVVVGIIILVVARRRAY
jgi:hypothetical protein